MHMPAHSHDHHHDHDHPVEDAYYLDQLCMVSLAGAFGVICLAMYYLQPAMLFRLLAPQFHVLILLCGDTLVILAVARALLLWANVGKREHEHHHHEHDHSHDHGHDHHHDHAHHHHDHGHDHHHHHDHDAADHDHGWAPWRYVVILLPIMLFLLGLPSRGLQSQKLNAADLVTDLKDQSVLPAGVIAAGAEPWVALPVAYAAYGVSLTPNEANATYIDFKTLDKVADREDQRDYWSGKTIRVKGQYTPSQQSDRVFGLVRWRIQCCAADSQQLNVPILSRESITHIKPDEWIEVIGQLEFRPRNEKSFLTLVKVVGAGSVRKTAPDLNPYIQ